MTESLPSLVDRSRLREPPTTARGVRTRAALVTAARVVFERDGYLDSRVTDITAEAGCSTGTFYTYFDDKAEIFVAVLEEAQHDMMHPGMPRVKGAEDDPATLFEASHRAYLLAYQRNAKLMMLLEQVATIDPDFARLRRRRARAFTERNAKGIRDLQRRGLADRDLDPSLTAACLSSMVSRMAYYTFALGDPYDLDTLVDTLTRLWLSGLGIPDSRPPARARID